MTEMTSFRSFSSNGTNIRTFSSNGFETIETNEHNVHLPASFRSRHSELLNEVLTGTFRNPQRTRSRGLGLHPAKWADPPLKEYHLSLLPGVVATDGSTLLQPRRYESKRDRDIGELLKKLQDTQRLAEHGPNHVHLFAFDPLSDLEGEVQSSIVDSVHDLKDELAETTSQTKQKETDAIRCQIFSNLCCVSDYFTIDTARSNSLHNNNALCNPKSLAK